jgi:DNA-binding CsgD family transcriptional regulator/PAS domain-containing protein
MSVSTVNPAPYTALERTLSVLLAPLEHPTWQAWQQAVHGQLLELTEADSLCIYTPLTTGADAWYAPHLSTSVLRDYAAQVREDSSWDVIETGFTQLAAQTGRQVAHESEFIDAGTRHTSAFHHDFLAPHGLNDLTVASAAFGGLGASRLHFANRRWRSESDRTARQQLVRTVLPAFRSGLATWRQLAHRHTDLAFLFDTLSEAILLYDAKGQMIHANRAAAHLMDQSNGFTLYEVERLRSEAASVARRISGLMQRAGVGAPTVSTTSATRDVRMTSGAFTVRGALAPAWMFGLDHGVIITIERRVARPLTDDELRARYGITTRELEVARAVAEGLSNQALAERLGVSFFTARNHVERVLGKLGAQNRAQVGPILLKQE